MHSGVRALHFPGYSCIQQPKCYFFRELLPPRIRNTRFSTCYIAIFSRKVVHSIAQICNTFQRICASRNLKYYISGNLCTQELKAQNFPRRPRDLCIQELKMPHGSLCLQELKHYIFPRELLHSRAPNAPRNCASRSSRHYIF